MCPLAHDACIAALLIPLCVSSLLGLLMLALPSDYVSEPCMVPVSCVSRTKLSPPGSSMSVCNQCMWACVSDLNYLDSRYDTRVRCISEAELSILSVVFLELSR